jgi:hypothetical protein
MRSAGLGQVVQQKDPLFEIYRALGGGWKEEAP